MSLRLSARRAVGHCNRGSDLVPDYVNESKAAGTTLALSSAVSSKIGAGSEKQREHKKQAIDI